MSSAASNQNLNTNASKKGGERYPGMRALAEKVFNNAPRTQHGQISQKLKHYLDVAKSQGIATTMNWGGENLATLEKKFGSAAGKEKTKEVKSMQMIEKPKRGKSGKQTLPSTEASYKAWTHPQLTAKLPMNQQILQNHPVNDTKTPQKLENNHLNSPHLTPKKRVSNMLFNETGNSKRRNVPQANIKSNIKMKQNPSTIPKTADRKSDNVTLKSQRQARFQNNSENSQSEAAPYVDSPIYGAIIGTNQQLEKPYFRLTGQVNPEVVRPPHILEQSLKLVIGKYEKDKSYAYVANQLQSIRQDLTVQHIETALTVETYEQNTRIALSNDDMGEFNKCLTRLTDLYEKLPEHSQNQQEFKAYSIYYTLLLRKWDQLSFVFQTLDTSLIDDDRGVQETSNTSEERNIEGEFPGDNVSRSKMLHRALLCVHSVLRETNISDWPSMSNIWPLEYKLLGKIIERTQARGLEGLLLSTFQQNQSLSLKDISFWLGCSQLQHGETTEVEELLGKWRVPFDKENKTVSSETALGPLQRFVAQVYGKFDIKGQI